MSIFMNFGCDGLWFRYFDLSSIALINTLWCLKRASLLWQQNWETFSSEHLVPLIKFEFSAKIKNRLRLEASSKSILLNLVISESLVKVTENSNSVRVCELKSQLKSTHKMASALPDDSFVPSPVRRWILPNLPLDFFRAFKHDYIACANGIYHLSQDLSTDDVIEDMDTEDDSPDLFGVSDIGKLMNHNQF